MKRIVLLLMVASMLFSSVPTLAHYGEIVDPEPMEPISVRAERADVFVSKKLTQNTDTMRSLFGNKSDAYIDEKSSVEISIQKDMSSLLMSIDYAGSKQETVLYGSSELIKTGGTAGYVGVYEGFIQPIQGRSLSAGEDGQIPVIADLVFTENDIRACITLGYADEKNNPDILFYGTGSDTINAVAKADACRAVETTEVRDEVCAEDVRRSFKEARAEINAVKARRDTSIYFIKSIPIRMGSYVVGNLSAYHSKNLYHQGSMTTYARVNTNYSNALRYAKSIFPYTYYNTHPGDMFTVKADRIIVSMCGQDKGLHGGTNTYQPQNNVDTRTFEFPIWLGHTLGLQTIKIKYNVSSVSVTSFGHDGGYNNGLRWDINRTNGWLARDVDGYYAETGMYCYADYKYEGNKSGPMNMGFTGRIRYKYSVVVNDQYFTGSFLSEEASFTTTVSVWWPGA